MRFVAAQNPFYLISACLVFYGLFALFENSAVASRHWWRVGLMVGYTGLMALTAFVIVRFGKVWDDARSLLMIVVLLFLATSVSLDVIGVRSIQQGMSIVPVILAALGGAALISWLLTRALGIRLRFGYSGPYYLILAVFFLYPLGGMLLQGLGYASDRETLAWFGLSFPLVQGLAFLTLLPALRRAREYVRENGTPWRWPGFPLLLFVMLAGAVCVRQYFISFSFMPARKMDSAFGLYSLVPFLLCVSILTIEFALASRRRWVRVVALAIPMLMIAFSFPGADRTKVYREVLGMVFGAVGSPVMLAVLAATLFYAYAWWRGAREAEIGLVVSLLIASVVGGATKGLGTLVAPRAWPLLAIGLAQAFQFVRKGGSWRGLAASCAAIGAVSASLRGTWFNAAYGVIPFHMAFGCAVALGVAMRDRFARFLQATTAVMLPVLVLGAVGFGGRLHPHLPTWARPVYALAVALTPFACYLLVRNRLYLITAAMGAGILLTYGAGAGYGELRRPDRPRGLVPIFWGSLSFLAALVISLLKGGIIQKGVRRLREACMSDQGP